MILRTRQGSVEVTAGRRSGIATGAASSRSSSVGPLRRDDETRGTSDRMWTSCPETGMARNIQRNGFVAIARARAHAAGRRQSAARPGPAVTGLVHAGPRLVPQGAVPAPAAGGIRALADVHG